MKYKGFYILEIPDTAVLKNINGVEQECPGMFFEVYADENYGRQIDSFCGAFDYDMENTEESIAQYMKNSVDSNLLKYKKEKFYVFLDEDYKAFEHDVRYCSEEYNPFDDAEKIANMKKAHELFMYHRPDISESRIDYILSLKRPLETIAEMFEHNDIAYLDSLLASVNKIEEEKINIFGELDEAEDDEEIEM